MVYFNTAYTQKPSYGDTGEQYYKPRIKTESEGNYVHIRDRATRGRHIFTLSWERISESEYLSIKSFFDKYSGSAFYWTHDVTNTTYTVIFADDIIESKFVQPHGYRSVTVRLEEL